MFVKKCWLSVNSTARGNHARYNIDETPVTDVLKAILLILDRLIDDEENQVHGFSIVDNLEGISPYHVLKVSRSGTIKAVVEMIQARKGREGRGGEGREVGCGRGKAMTTV